MYKGIEATFAANRREDGGVMTGPEAGGVPVGEQSSSVSPSPISLVIPGRAEYIALCRLVAGAVGAQEAVDEEAIADLKVIVTEACNCFLEKGAVENGAGPSIRVEFEALPDGLAITVSDADRRRRLVDPDGGETLSDTALALTIMKALADEVEQRDTEAGGSQLRLVKRLPAPAGTTG